LEVRKGPFRRIVCFQSLDPLFVSHESQPPSRPHEAASRATPLSSEKQ
jgi:hypothetical protein